MHWLELPLQVRCVIRTCGKKNISLRDQQTDLCFSFFSPKELRGCVVFFLAADTEQTPFQHIVPFLRAVYFHKRLKFHSLK